MHAVPNTTSSRYASCISVVRLDVPIPLNILSAQSSSHAITVDDSIRLSSLGIRENHLEDIEVKFPDRAAANNSALCRAVESNSFSVRFSPGDRLTEMS